VKAELTDFPSVRAYLAEWGPPCGRLNPGHGRKARPKFLLSADKYRPRRKDGRRRQFREHWLWLPWPLLGLWGWRRSLVTWR